MVAFVAREPLANVLPSSSLRGPHASARDRAGWSVEAPLATMAERFGFETGKLVMSQFRSRTRIGRKKRLLEEAEKILRSGAVEQPKWFNALKTCVARPKSLSTRPTLAHRRVRGPVGRAGAARPRASASGSAFASASYPTPVVSIERDTRVVLASSCV